MKKIVALFMACFATALFGQAPPILRNPFTTNSTPSARGIVTNIVDSVVQRISILGGNNGLIDMVSSTPNTAGQLGISQNLNRSGGDGVVFLWASFTNNALGSNGWGAGITIPEWDGNGAVWPFASPRHNNSNPRIRVNGSPAFATRSNATDANFYFENYNPFGDSVMSFPSKTTNILYNYYGSGTYNNVIGTNSSGQPIFHFDIFGLTIGSIHPEWIAGVTNQAGSSAIILGSSGMANPFHISDNSTFNSFLGQYPYLTIDRRGVTNLTFPIVIGFPRRTDNTYEPTQANWLWSLVTDLRTGATYITNGLLTVSNLLSTATNKGAVIFGGNYENTAEFNVNGSASFNVENVPNGFYGAWTFDAAKSHRQGFQVQPGFHTKQVFASGAPYQLAQSSATDLQAGQSTASLTNLFVIDSRHGYYSNLTDFSFIGSTKVGVGTPTPSVSLEASNTANTIALFAGNIADYSQVKVKNFNTSAGASGDFVVEAGHGTETNHFIDIGINGPNGGSQPFTNGGHAYIFSQPSNNQPHALNIGAIGSNSSVRFYAGAPIVGTSGVATNPVERMRIETNGFVGIGTNAPGVRLDVQGHMNLSGGFTNFGDVSIQGGNLSGPSFVNINVGAVNKIGAGGSLNTMYQDTVVQGSLGAGVASLGGGNVLSSLYVTNASARPAERIDNIRTNATALYYDGTTPVLQFAIETNGIAVYGNSGSTVTNTLAGVGYTNTTAIQRIVYATMTAVAYTLKDGAGVVVDARTATGTIPFILRPGWGVSAASGLTGTVADF